MALHRSDRRGATHNLPPLLVGAALMVLRVALHNPMHIADDDRAKDLTTIFVEEDLVLFQGTGRRGRDPELPIERRRHEHHVEVAWLWRRSRFCNKSTGCSMFMRPSLERNIRRLWEAPPGLAGRVAAARFRTDQHDVAVILVYCPVRRSLVDKDYVEYIQKICGFVDRVISECGASTLPLIAGDFTDHFGLRRQADGQV